MNCIGISIQISDIQIFFHEKKKNSMQNDGYFVLASTC